MRTFEGCKLPLRSSLQEAVVLLTFLEEPFSSSYSRVARQRILGGIQFRIHIRPTSPTAGGAHSRRFRGARMSASTDARTSRPPHF